MRLKSYALISKLPSPARVLKISILAFSFFIIVLAFTPWQQNAIGSGRVIAFSPTDREYTINSPITGRIYKWYVNEGDHLKKGQKIVDIRDIDPDLIERLHIEKQAIRLRMKAASSAIKASNSNVLRQGKLFKAGINSQKTYEIAKIQLARYESELAQARVDLLKVKTKIARQSSQLVLAQSDGIIHRRLSGQDSVIVKQGEILARVLPKTSSRAAEIYVNGNDIPFIRLNQKARLEFEGWPAIQFRGWPDVAVGTFGGRVAFIDPTDNKKGFFRVVIIPDEKWPAPNFLRQGVKVQGWVLFGEVKLWYELWRQFNGFPPISSEFQQ